MTDHVHIYNFGVDGRSGRYDVDIFQCAYDEICISIQNTLYSPDARSVLQFDIPVRKAPGFCWKCNVASIGENEGKAENIISLFKNNDAYAWASVRRLIFEHPKKRMTAGL